MTDYMDKELKWDDEVDEVRELPPIANFPDFGCIRLVGVKKVTLFSSGERITLPDVIINGEPFSWGGMKEGWTSNSRNNAYAFFLRFDGVNMKTGDPFTMVNIFTDQTQIPVNKTDEGIAVTIGSNQNVLPVIKLNQKQEKALEENDTAWISDWSNLQYVALKQSLNAKQQDAFGKGEPFYFRAETFTYHMRENPNNLGDDGKPKRYYDKYRHDFTIYETEVEMSTAREAYKNEQGVMADASNGNDHYPASWKTDIQGMLDYCGQQIQALDDMTEVAKNTRLFENGQPADNINGHPVDVKAILKECVATIDVPDALKEGLYKKVETYQE